ncbi:hypothetical protein AWB76_00914 [Caballeronia temeraria]|uniref:Uncharacterized protein n=1 Tax=Caballeronia temeraria TaxID=1777137 RepID=A0A157ZLP6_9BURK|nr:hypothetical protein [Caballeronia temeraria]SAK46444.1 hypothetical protein AWB76_00914 [Caballeronia temeraria]
MDELAIQLNALTTYPTVSDLHKLAEKLKQYAEADIAATLLPALTNKLLVEDIKKLLKHPPSLISAPIFSPPTAPTDPNYPGVDPTQNPGVATDTE